MGERLRGREAAQDTEISREGETRLGTDTDRVREEGGEGNIRMLKEITTKRKIIKGVMTPNIRRDNGFKWVAGGRLEQRQTLHMERDNTDRTTLIKTQPEECTDHQHEGVDRT